MSTRMFEKGLLCLGMVLAPACGEGAATGGDPLATAGTGDTAAADTCAEDFPVGEVCACAVTFDWSALGVEPASVDAYVLDLGRDDAVDAVCDEALTQAQLLSLWSWPETLGAPPPASFDLSAHDGRALLLTAMDETGMILGQRAFTISASATGTVAAL